VNTKKVNVGVKGQFKSLSEAAASSSNLEISFTSSEIPNVMPEDLNTILKTIEEFPSKVYIQERLGFQNTGKLLDNKSVGRGRSIIGGGGGAGGIRSLRRKK
jgi:hypothetical protein